MRQLLEASNGIDDGFEPAVAGEVQHTLQLVGALSTGAADAAPAVTRPAEYRGQVTRNVQVATARSQQTLARRKRAALRGPENAVQ